MFVKICGMTSEEAIHAAVTAGADAIGFVFAESPRRIAPDKAAQLCRDLPEDLVRVAVMQHPSAEEWQEVREQFTPDWLQTDAEDFPALDLPAARTGRIHLIDGTMVSWYGPRIAESIRILADLFANR